MSTNETPLRCIALGALAGVTAGAIMNGFFRVTERITPPRPNTGFCPPDERQESENATATVARRFVEDFMRRGPLTDDEAKRAARLVHYLFAAGWGALFGIANGSFDSVRRSPFRATSMFSFLVWMISDNLILPGFRLSAWPHEFPVRNHAYALAAHLAYGGATVAAYEGISRGLDALEPRGKGESRLPVREDGSAGEAA